jgi:hypothetical protein
MKTEIILGVIVGIVRHLGIGLLLIGFATWGIARWCSHLRVWGVIIPAAFAIVAVAVLVVGVVLKNVWRP